MRVVRELITPDRASELLMMNTANRPVRQGLVARYANDMINGRWNSETGETIKVNRRGQLPDGQHRLHAVIKAGVPIVMYIAYDVANDAFEVIDSGLRRQAKDVLYIAGATNPTRLAALIGKYYNLKRGVSSLSNQDTAITSAMVLDIYESNADLWISILNQSESWYDACNKIIPPSIIGGYYAYLREIDEDDAYNFFQQLCGKEYSIFPAIMLLKDKMIQDKISNKKMLRTYRHALIIKAWNFYRKGKEVKILKYLPDEEIPTAI